MADIEQEVKFIGMGDTIEIWSAARTAKPFMEPDEFGKALEEVMGGELQSPLQDVLVD